jgi:hypothetical protein
VFENGRDKEEWMNEATKIREEPKVMEVMNTKFILEVQYHKCAENNSNHFIGSAR